MAKEVEVIMEFKNHAFNVIVDVSLKSFLCRASKSCFKYEYNSLHKKRVEVLNIDNP